MKKILFILSLFIINNVSFAQVKVGSEGNIIPTGIYPALKSADLKGSIHPFQTIIQRNDLPANYRDTGMIAYVGDSTKYYSLIGGIANSNWQEFSGGGSTNIDSLVKYYVPCPDSTCWYGLNWNRDTLYKWKAVYDTSGGSGGISYYQLDSTATAVRADIPAQFNPIAGTNITTTGTYPNITFNASGGTYTLPIASASILGGVKIGSGLSIDGSGILSSTGSGGSVTNVSANAPLSVTNPTTTPNIVADTSKSQGKLATFNDVLIHKDSSAYHTSQVLGDTSLVLCDLKGRCDTIAISSINIWQRNGNSIYYNNGRVGIGVDTAQSLLNVQNLSTIANAPLNDSSGVTLSNGNIATSSNIYYSPPLIFKSQNWNTSTLLPFPTKFKFDVNSFSGVPGPSFSNLNLKYSIDNGLTYLTLWSFGGNGLLSNGNTNINSNSVSSLVGSFTSGLSTSGNLSATYSTNIGSAYSDSSALFQINTTNKGFLPPRLTTAQRNLINTIVTGVTITNAGSGYTSTPTVTFSGSVYNPAIIANGVAVVTSNTVTGINIVNRGSYFSIPAISITGGGGSGATATAITSQNLGSGLTIYCTDCTATDSSTGVMQTWNGSTWKNNW